MILVKAYIFSHIHMYTYMSIYGNTYVYMPIYAKLIHTCRLVAHFFKFNVKIHAFSFKLNFNNCEKLLNYALCN